MSASTENQLVELTGTEGSYGSRLFAHLSGMQCRPLALATPNPNGVAWVAVHHAGQLVELLTLFRYLRCNPYRAARSGHPFVVFGGYGTTNPEVLGDIADAVVLGDGEEIAERIAAGEDCREWASGDPVGWYKPGDWRPEYHGWRLAQALSPEAMAAACELRSVPPIMTRASGKDSLPTFELARGCPNKCKFCAVGQTKPYRERTEAAAQDAMRHGAQRLFCPDMGSLSYWQEADWLVTTAGGLSVRAALKRPEAIVRCNPPTMGIEGWSARLRAIVGKPITDEQLREVCNARLAGGKRQLLWYMMHSLPGSNAKDRMAFVDLVRSLPSVTIRLSITPYQKLPHTPLAAQACSWQAAERLHAQRIATVSATAKILALSGKGETRHLCDTLCACGNRNAGRMLIDCGEKLLKMTPPQIMAASAAYGTSLAEILGEWPEQSLLPWGHVSFGRSGPR